MLELKNINLSLNLNDRPLVESLSFTLNRGDIAVIIGEEGNGKSTLLKLIYNEKHISDYCQYSGKITRNGRLAYLPQAFPHEQLGFTLEKYFEHSDFFPYAKLFADLDLPPELLSSQQIIKTLSGGEKIKIQLAKMLMSEPDILLLDEPTNDIDIETLSWLENFINRCKLPIMFVSHDETLIENTANTIIHIEQLVRKSKCRVTISRCSYAEYIKSRANEFNKQMQIAKKQRSEHSAKLQRWQDIYNSVEHKQRTITRQDPYGGKVLKKKMKSIKSQEKRLNRDEENFAEIPQAEEAIITKFGEHISIPKGKVVLDLHISELSSLRPLDLQDIHLRIMGGEHVGIVGKNGIGKTTLLNEIWQILKDRHDLTAYYMPQEYSTHLDFNKTPIDFLTPSQLKSDITRARTYMGSMKLTDGEMTGKIANLSGGQKAKILFLDMVLKNADVLILDEPTRNFSPLSNPVIRHTLTEFKGTIISVSHDRKYLDEVCERVYELFKNKPQAPVRVP